MELSLIHNSLYPDLENKRARIHMWSTSQGLLSIVISFQWLPIAYWLACSSVVSYRAKPTSSFSDDPGESKLPSPPPYFCQPHNWCWGLLMYQALATKPTQLRNWINSAFDRINLCCLGCHCLIKLGDNDPKPIYPELWGMSSRWAPSLGMRSYFLFCNSKQIVKFVYNL